MKRIIAFILSLYFLFGNIGISNAAHFCGQLEIRNTVTIGNPKHDCGMHGANSNSNLQSASLYNLSQADCCKDVIHTFKVKSDYISKINPKDKIAIVLLLDLYTSHKINLLDKQNLLPPPLQPPVLSAQNSLSLLQVYRI